MEDAKYSTFQTKRWGKFLVWGLLVAFYGGTGLLVFNYPLTEKLFFGVAFVATGIIYIWNSDTAPGCLAVVGVIMLLVGLLSLGEGMVLIARYMQ